MFAKPDTTFIRRGKNVIKAAITTFELVPKPNQTTIGGPVQFSVRH
jgi:hypothetical protein